MSEKTLQEEIENTVDSQEDLDEAYKTKAQMKDELSDVLSGMNRNDLMQAYQSVVSTPEAPVAPVEPVDPVSPLSPCLVKCTDKLSAAEKVFLDAM